MEKKDLKKMLTYSFQLEEQLIELLEECFKEIFKEEYCQIEHYLQGQIESGIEDCGCLQGLEFFKNQLEMDKKQREEYKKKREQNKEKINVE